MPDALLHRELTYSAGTATGELLSPRPERPAVALWRLYAELESEQQAVVRALIFPDLMSSETLTGSLGLGTSTTSFDVPATIVSRTEGDLPYAPRHVDWDLAASSIPAFVPQEWVDELRQTRPSTRERFDIDWEA